MHRYFLLALTLGLFCFSFSFFSEAYGEFKSQGEVALEGRQFKADGLGQTLDYNISIFSRLEAQYENNFLGQKHVIRGFSRIDSKDNDRSFMTIEDGYGSIRLGSLESWQLTAGYKLYNWTALEAFHPVDQVNSRNFDGQLERLEKKGELVFEVEKTYEGGAFQLFYFPHYENPQYPGDRSRLSSQVDLNTPYWVDETSGLLNKNQWGEQYGMRLTHTFGATDVSFSYLKHMDRNYPLIGTHKYMTVFGQLIPTELPNTPYFFKVDQWGATLQHAWEAWLFKFEGAYRQFKTKRDIYVLGRGLRAVKDHAELAVGSEYLWDHEGGLQSTFLLEMVSFFGMSETERSERSILQRDAFLGWRFAFNDPMGKEIFSSIIFDLERSHEILFHLAYQQRLNNFWKIEFGARLQDAPQKKAVATGLELLHNDHYAYFRLSRFF